MKTSELFQICFDYLSNLNLDLNVNLNDWIESFDLHSNEIIKYIQIQSGYNVDLFQNDFKKKVMHKIFISSVKKEIDSDWDKNYVRNKYSTTIDNCDILYYPSKNPKNIIFNFSSMGFDKYDRYSRYWDKTEMWNSDTVFVFFKDDNYSYYLGNDTDKTGTYYKLIRDFCNINDLKIERDAITVGSSMGGYAALFYAIQLDIKSAIVSVPQTNYDITKTHSFRNWEKHISKINHWIDLDLLIHRKPNVPNLYIEYGSYFADLLASEKFLSEYRKHNCFLIENKKEWTEHTNDDILEETILNKIINLFSNLKDQ